MPWFRKAHKSKRKFRVSKKDISEPTDFKHCYHAVLDHKNAAFSGLPPQWSTLVAPTKEDPSEQPSNKAPSTSSQGVVQDKNRHKSDKKSYKGASKKGVCGENSHKPPTSEDECSIISSTSGHLTSENNARNLHSSSKYSIASSNSNLSLTKRPSPLIRGSDTSLEDTIKFIRKHCQNRSNESFQGEEELQSSSNKHPQPHPAHAISRGRIYSQSRTGSFMQLRSSPVNRKHVVSYTSSSTSAMTQGGDQLPSSAFCLSAPSEVIQSDLGLYFNRTEMGSGLSHHRINSPSESSGYFGSNGSSLCNSRMSSAQHISSSVTPTPSNTQHHYTTPSTSTSMTHAFSKPSDVQEADEEEEEKRVPSSAHVHHPASYHQRFYSLQRRHEPSGATGGHHAYTYRHPVAVSGYGAVQRGAMMTTSHYGTTPRSHRTLHGTYSMGASNTAETEGFHKIHEYSEEQDSYEEYAHGHEALSLKSSNASASAYPPPPSNTTTHKKEKIYSRMNFDQFRTTLELLVNPADPRREYVDFVKIGEGSTGNVYTARHVSSNHVVAVKKMNLWKQQRRELLFNEVSDPFIV